MSQFIEMFKDVSYRVALEDVVYIKDDCRKPINDGVRSAMKDGELYPYYGATGVVDYINDYITNEQLLCIAEDCGNYKADEESSYIINGKAWVNNHAHVVKPKDSCSIEYLHQYLKMLDLMPYVSGTTRLKLTQKKMKEIPVILPSMERQMEFVAFTNQADKSEFGGSKSQFIEMFNGDFPMERWEECLSITNGKKYDGEYQQSGTYPICGSGGIMGYGKQKLCPGKTVILGRKGNINSPIFMESEYWIVDTAFCLDVDKQKLHPKYFYYWCKQFDFTRYNKQGVLPSLTKNDLLKIEMPIPPMELQVKFVNIIEQADKSEYGVRKPLDAITTAIKSSINN